MLNDDCIIVIEDLKEEAIDVKEPIYIKETTNLWDYIITNINI